MSFEDEFNVQLEMSEEIKTVADIVAVIEKQLAITFKKCG